MSFISWAAVVIIGFNVLFFGVLALIAFLEDRKRGKK